MGTALASANRRFVPALGSVGKMGTAGEVRPCFEADSRDGIEMFAVVAVPLHGRVMQAHEDTLTDRAR